MAKLAPAQIEQLIAIGARLKQVRQDQGVAIEQVANQVFIRPALLQALEDGQAEVLPEPVFVQGFIRRYAEALGLDGLALSKEFAVTPVNLFPNPAATPSTPAEPTNGAANNGATTNGATANDTTTHGPTPADSQPVPTPMPAPVSLTPAPTPKSSAKTLVGLWVAGGVVGLGVLIGLGVSLFGGSTPETDAVNGATESAPAPEPEPPSPNEPEPAEPEPAEPEPTEPEPAATPDAPVVVSLTVVDPSWLEVTVDGTVVLSETVTPASSDGGSFAQTWTAQELIVVNAGNAGAVELSANGSDGVVLGNPGQVRRIQITPDSDAASLQTP